MTTSKYLRSTHVPLPPEPKSILLVHNAFSRFVQLDCELLAKNYALTVRFESSPRKLNVFDLWRQVRRHDLVYCWFASWHSFFPVLFARLQRKPSVVVIGGYDVASVPQAGYGSQRGGVSRFITRIVMTCATRLLPFSEAAAVEAVTKAGAASEKCSVIYLGVHTQDCLPEHPREKIALSVGFICKENLLRKGLLPFVQASTLMPDVQFVHAGPCADNSVEELRKAAGPNVSFLGFVSDDKLSDLFQRASVYVQASLHEGFGMSVAESMAAGCIPVTSQFGSLPEIVGDAGVYLTDVTPAEVAEGIKAGLRLSCETRVRAQKRVRDLFSLGERERRLQAVLDALLSIPGQLRQGEEYLAVSSE